MVEAILLALSPIVVSVLTQFAKFIGRKINVLKDKWNVRLVSAVIAFLTMSLSGIVDEGIITEFAMALVVFISGQGTYFLTKKLAKK